MNARKKNDLDNLCSEKMRQLLNKSKIKIDIMSYKYLQSLKFRNIFSPITCTK